MKQKRVGQRREMRGGGKEAEEKNGQHFLTLHGSVTNSGSRVLCREPRQQIRILDTTKQVSPPHPSIYRS